MSDKVEIQVSDGGHPIWAAILINGQRVGSINSLYLADLEHAARQARFAAKRVAERYDPKRVDHY